MIYCLFIFYLFIFCLFIYCLFIFCVLLEHEKCHQYNDAGIYQVAANIFTPLHDFFAFLL